MQAAIEKEKLTTKQVLSKMKVVDKWKEKLGVDAACAKAGVNKSSYYYHKAKEQNVSGVQVKTYDARNVTIKSAPKKAAKLAPLSFTPQQVVALLLAGRE